MNIIGRIEEIDSLKKIYNSNRPEFLALFGRRRVGKTFLIREFFSNKNVIFFNVTGSKDGSMKDQIKHFTIQLSEAFYDGIKLYPEKNWDDAFAQLTKAIKQAGKKKKIILFFDELPWMATKRSKLLQNLDYYWNQHWSNDNKIKLIICGSSAAWILNNIIRNKGGLHNRVTQKINLEPFSLQETKLFLHKIGINLNNTQILLLYMVTGGIPYYLMQAEPGLTAMQLIEKLAFTKKAFLLGEFDNLFRSLFNDGEVYEEIVRIIAKHRYGIGQRRLLESIGKQIVGGIGVQKLKALEETGFIIGFKPLFHKKKGIYYRVTDEYTLFYLKWIEPLRNKLQKQALDEGNWQSMQKTPEWHNWLGYAFESVCYKHLSLIRKTLKLDATAIADTWRYVPRKAPDRHGTQIDLLFDRRDNAITICEIKYTEKPFILTKDYVDVLNRRITIFREQTRTKKQIFMALISANDVKNNYYVENMFTKIVTANDLFKD